MNDQETHFPEQDAGLGAASAVPSLGAVLAAARESKGWTIEQVSHYLKLAPRQVEAIEAGNLAALPGPAVTRGFIRAYAKLLSVDVTPYMSSLGAAIVSQPDATARQPLATPFKEGRRSIGGRHGAARFPARLIVSVALLIGAIALVTVWQSQRGQVGNAAGSAGAPAQALPAAPGSGTSPEVAEMPGLPPVASSVESASPAANGPDSANAAHAPIAGSPSDSLAMSGEQVSAASAAMSGNLLELVMNKDSWLELRRIDTKEVIASRLVKAGTIETFEIDAPVALKVGNASGVQATFRGAPLDLRASASNNVARLTLK